MMINVDPRDRTDEFCKILQTVEFKSKPLPPPKISKKTEFYIIANEVGIGINQTADKLQRLAERKQLFFLRWKNNLKNTKIIFLNNEF